MYNINNNLMLLNSLDIVILFGGLIQMINNGDELRELVSLVEQFVEIADELKRNGKIDEEQYIYITKNKIEFLKESKELME